MIDFESLDDHLDLLIFAIHDLAISSVFFNESPVPYSSSPGKLSVPLSRKLKRGERGKISVEYSGAPQQGIIFGEHSVYTSYDTCHWMICDQNNPGDKAVFKLILNLPKELGVVASGTEVSSEPLPDGQVRHTWEQVRPYSPYLFGFAAGKFHVAHSKAGSTSLDFYAESIPAEKLSRIFEDTGSMIEFFEKKSGVPFPNSRYSQVVVPEEEAQEASSFSVLGRRYVESIIENPKEDWAPVHELAHQWWGNLITCQSWDHFWLNEGFAVFMTAAYKEARWGRVEYEREMERARKKFQVAKVAGQDVPLTRATTLPLKLRRAIQYSKAALFLDTLRKTMGEKKFWAAIKEYSQKFAGKAVESQDLAKVMESHGGPEVVQLFRTWVY